MIGRGKGKASHDVIDVPFFSVGKEDQAVAILTYVNGFWDELSYHEVHVEISVGDSTGVVPSSRHGLSRDPEVFAFCLFICIICAICGYFSRLFQRKLHVAQAGVEAVAGE